MAARKLKFVVKAGTVGSAVNLNLGDAWEASDPVVKEFPDFFADEPKKVRRSVGAPVEDASADPGRKRTTRRSAD